MDFVLAWGAGNNGSADELAVYGDAAYALLLAIGIFYHDVVLATTELAHYLIFLSGAWKAGIDEKTLVVGLDAENEFADGVPHPCCGACEP